MQNFVLQRRKSQRLLKSKKQNFDQNHKDEVFSQKILKAKHRFAKKRVFKTKQKVLNSSIIKASKSNFKMKLYKKKFNKKDCKEVVLHFFLKENREMYLEKHKIF